MEQTQTGQSRLGPLDLGRILELSWRLYRRNLGTLVVAWAVVMVPMALLSVVHAYVDGQLGTYDLQRQLSAAQTARDPAAYQNMDWSVLAYSQVIAIGIYSLAGPLSFFAIGATAWIVSDRLLGGKGSLAEAYDFVLSRFWPLLGAGVAVTLLTILGLFTCGILSIVFAIWFAFSAPLVIIERLGAGEALARSRGLVEGSWWRVFGIWLVVAVVAGLAGAIVAMPLYFLAMPTGPMAESLGDMGAQMIARSAQSLVGMFTAPFMYVAVVLLYFDMRSRKEPYFDLNALAINLGREAQAPPFAATAVPPPEATYAPPADAAAQQPPAETWAPPPEGTGPPAPEGTEAPPEGSSNDAESPGQG